MFDPKTSDFLRSAPALDGLDPDRIPQILTFHYAQLVSARMGGNRSSMKKPAESEWSLDQIADAYELIASVHEDPGTRRASAFVAATAQQILARGVAAGESAISPVFVLNRDGVDGSLAAALLFLAAEQYADANEAANAIRAHGTDHQADTLCERIKDLAQGRLHSILLRRTSGRLPLLLDAGVDDIESSATSALLGALIEGIETLAQEVTDGTSGESLGGAFGSKSDAIFNTVGMLALGAAGKNRYTFEGALTPSYPGPRHLASLLRSAGSALRAASLASVLPPSGADPDIWNAWIRHRTISFPYVWPNHRSVIEQGFYQTGHSAVLVLPTGAGKTTVSSLKIAGVLAAGKKIVFLAPTHALVEQLTEDLQEMFPQSIIGSRVSSDFDLLLRPIFSFLR